MLKYLTVFLFCLGCTCAPVLAPDSGIQCVDGGGDTELILCDLGEYKGDVKIHQQADVVKYKGYTSITLDLKIDCSDCTDLKNLACLQAIGDYFLVANTDLVSLEGLENIESVGGNLCIYHNGFLPDCEACTFLDRLSEMPEQVTVYDNMDDGCSPVLENCP